MYIFIFLRCPLKKFKKCIICWIFFFLAKHFEKILILYTSLIYLRKKFQFFRTSLDTPFRMFVWSLSVSKYLLLIVSELRSRKVDKALAFFIFFFSIILTILSSKINSCYNTNLLLVLVEHAVNVQIGGSCGRDFECIENAFCRGQQNCLCDPYYSPSPDKSMCIASECLLGNFYRTKTIVTQKNVLCIHQKVASTNKLT